MNTFTTACQHITENDVQGAVFLSTLAADADIKSIITNLKDSNRAIIVVDEDVTQLQNTVVPSLHRCANENKVNFIFHNLDKKEFFTRYSDGVPVYDLGKKIIKKYALVTLTSPTVDELDYFLPRMGVNSVLVVSTVDAKIQKLLTDEKFFPLTADGDKQVYSKMPMIKKTIAFVTDSLAFNGNSLEEKTLGGSESAMIYMARELAKLDNIVTVYCNCDKPGEYNNVVYRKIGDFVSQSQVRYDVLIMSRTVQYTPEMDAANLNIFWMHDLIAEDFCFHAYKADKVFLMSEYQKDVWTNVNYAYGDMIHITRNGFDIDLALKTKILPFDQRKNNYIFASKPERGLKYLLSNIWPDIIKMNSDAKLHICTYINDLPMPEEGRKIHRALEKEINDLAYATEGIIRQGNLHKRDLYKLLGQCAYMVYPCVFPEISCISAIEAQAMGVMVIAPRAFALAETVKSDTLVDGEQGTIETDQKFMEYVTKYQNKNEFLATMGPVVNEVRNTYSWSRIAAQWDMYFNQMFVERYNEFTPQVLKRLSYNSDHVTRSHVDANFDNAVFEQSVKNNLQYEFFQIVKEENIENPLAFVQGKRSVSIWDRIDDYVNENKKKKLTVMELGSYDGMLIGHVYAKHKEYIKEVIVYEGLKDAIEANRKNWNPDGTEPFKYVNDNLINLPKHNLKADIIIAGEILEHMQDWKKFLEEIHNCLNPGGLVVFSTPSGPWSSVSLHNRKQGFEFDPHLIHFEFLDLLTIFQEHLVDNEFDIEYHITNDRTVRNDALNHFTFSYVNNNADVKFHDINYEHKAIKTRPYFSISTIMITRNEEDYLSKCLKSVYAISDEIIVVDTGSTDDTKRIAAKFTDKIYDYKWEEEDGLGDFAKARNYSLDKATGDWAFYIDADEEVLYPEFVPLYINSPYYDTICIKQKQLMINDDPTWDQNANRLFRTKGKHRFYGAIHEFPRLGPTDGYGPLSVIIPTAVIAHYGYVNPKIVSDVKLKRNHDLLLKDIKKCPSKLDNYAYLIRDMWYFYKETNDTKYLYKAIEVFDKYPKELTTRYSKYKWIESYKCIQNFRAELVSRFNQSNFIKVIDGDTTIFAESTGEYEKYEKVMHEINTFNPLGSFV